jgi:hypothetical protein
MALFPLLFSLARSFFAPRLELMAEILALHRQPAILNRTTKRPSLRFQDKNNDQAEGRARQRYEPPNPLFKLMTVREAAMQALKQIETR